MKNFAIVCHVPKPEPLNLECIGGNFEHCLNRLVQRFRFQCVGLGNLNERFMLFVCTAYTGSLLLSVRSELAYQCRNNQHDTQNGQHKTF